jgi:hypothetical protein
MSRPQVLSLARKGLILGFLVASIFAVNSGMGLGNSVTRASAPSACQEPCWSNCTDSCSAAYEQCDINCGQTHNPNCVTDCLNTESACEAQCNTECHCS